MAKVTIREHAIVETDQYGLEVKKSLNQDMVFVNDRLAGYLSYTSKKFLPLTGWNNAHNDMVCEALQKLKPADFGTITHVDAQPIDLEVAEVDE